MNKKICSAHHITTTQKHFFFDLDLRKLYTSKCMDPDINPETLQNKVQWDLRFYFARRENENIDKFTKGTFQLKKHTDSGLRYIVKCYDEQTKNHQMDITDIQTACMVEVPDSKYCPVKSFLKYKSHLSPLINDFWQYSKETNWYKSDVWYMNKRIGHNPLSAFMSKMSHDADLSQTYTNHSIRVTSMTYLSRKEFSAKQIMLVTGHKSLNSLAIYQKISTDEKLSMAYTMSCYLHNDNSPPLIIVPHAQKQIKPPQLQVNATVTKQGIDITPGMTPSAPLQNTNVNNNNNKMLVPYESEDPFGDEEIPDFDLRQIMETTEKENFTITQTASETSKMTNIMQQCQLVQKRSPQIPIFNNCKIGTINITINMK